MNQKEKNWVREEKVARFFLLDFWFLERKGKEIVFGK